MHKPGWLHFENRALDVRGNNISVAKANGLRARVMALVGKDYHVQLLVGGGEAHLGEHEERALERQEHLPPNA